MLIVDPATGAMYKLPDKFSVNLAPKSASTQEPQSRVLNDEVVKRAQISLQVAGYYKGSITGVLDEATRAAIRSYKRDHGLQGYGYLDGETLSSLGIQVPNE